MRPWLLIPVVLPGLWAGITYADLWPDEVVGWIASPVFAVLVTLGGIAIAMLADNVIRAQPLRNSHMWFRREPKQRQDNTLEDVPLVSGQTPISQAWRATKTTFDLQVGMPERCTATPAPRA